MTKTPVLAGASEKKGNSMPITDMLPPMILPDDSARTRKSDPLTSHAAADVSQRGLRDAKRHVLQLVETLGTSTGSELNEMYQLWASRMDWRRLAWDSPRKRASELASDGFLEVVGTRVAVGNNVPESAYGITDKGRKALA